MFKNYFFCFFVSVGFFISAVLQGQSALADSLSATGGLAFGRNTGMNDLKNSNPIIGAQYTFNLSPRFELGGFYDYMMLTVPDGNSGSIRFMGMMMRFDFADPTVAGLYVDAKLGVAQREEVDVESNNIPTMGVGMGYRIPLSNTVSLGPRADLQYLPDSTSADSGRQAFVTGGVMLSIHL